MLSRFSKLPGLTFFAHGSNYPKEAIESAVSDIKKLGRRSINGEESLKDIQHILNYMKEFSESIQVQRVSCHALSNLAMQVVAARWIIQKGGFKLIYKCMSKFHGDHKLCWLGSSAIWNLARPPVNRNVIGKEGCKLMLKVLKEHQDKEKVTNTAIGALSNLSLLEELKDLISKKDNLKIVLNVMKEYLKRESISVMTSGAGLIANLAVSDEHANTLIKNNALPILLNLLLWHHKQTTAQNKTDDSNNNNTDTNETLYRNTCAALNNLVTANDFLNNILYSRGIEIIYDFLSSNSDNQMFYNLLENCLVNIDCDTNKITTSFHIAAYHNKLNILKTLIKEHPTFNLNMKDENNMTPLDYAMLNNPTTTANQQNNNNDENDEKVNNDEKLQLEKEKCHKCVELLSKCGATEFDNTRSCNKDFLETVHKGQQMLKRIKLENKHLLMNQLKEFPEDLCHYLVGFQGNVDLLEGMKLF